MGQSSGRHCAGCRSALGWQSLMVLQSVMLGSSEPVLHTSVLGLPAHGRGVELALKSLISKSCHSSDTPLRTKQGLSQKESFLPLMKNLQQIFWSRH